jgi:hypothetical protein
MLLFIKRRKKMKKIYFSKKKMMADFDALGIGILLKYSKFLFLYIVEEWG